jgi:arsenite-transporting ATPase
MDLIDTTTRHLFFTGKGGVGKTSLACATAIALAERGKCVLLVSTDPASNLDQVLGVRLGRLPTAIEAVPGLYALNIDPEEAAAAYRERAIGPYRDRLPEEAIRRMEEQLSGACTTEIAAFDEFAGLLAEPAQPGAFDHIVFDTAPTGHTLRLLRLPAAWSGFLETNVEGESCLGPSAALKTSQSRYAAAVAALGDARRTLLVLVSRPEHSALREAARSAGELQALGIANQRLVINGVFHARDRDDPVALALERRGAQALAAMPASLRSLPTTEVPLQGHNLVGIDALRKVLSEPEEIPPTAAVGAVPALPGLPSLVELVDELALPGHGLIMVMGKGGVGKTTVAAAIAVKLAAKGLLVHLSTTDPAAHVAAAVETAVAGLTVSRIDPVAETRAYTERVLATAGRNLDAEGRTLLEENLRSPCTEEIAVFHAFSRIVSQARKGFVVLDTAPTGHTLLLLDATGAYHRQVLHDMKGYGGKTTTPLMRLRDPNYTQVLLITLPETTPVLEASQLQDDLRRAEIEPYAWIINNSLAASGTRDPVLRQRAQAELEQIDKVRRELAQRAMIVPWMSEEPKGPERLGQLVKHGVAR